MKHQNIKILLSLLVVLVFSLPSIAQTETKQEVKTSTTVDQAELAYQKRIKKSRLNGVYIPKDLYDSFKQLDRLMDGPTRNKFKHISEEDAGKKFYLIIWMCNNWGLYEGSRLSHYLRNMSITNPEYMAHFLITAYHRTLNEKELDLKNLVAFYVDKQEKEKKERMKNSKVIHQETRKRPRN